MYIHVCIYIFFSILKGVFMSLWKIDKFHSEIMFKVKHLMITNVTGQFESFDAEMKSDLDDFTDAVISFEADVNSINTKNEQRDGHLKSDDFFNADKFPKIKFQSKKFIKLSDNNYKLIGDFTIRDITKEIELDVEFGGIMTDFYGNTKAGFEITGKINRFDYNLSWNAVTEAGGIVVSPEVKLILNIQMQKVS